MLIKMLDGYDGIDLYALDTTVWLMKDGAVVTVQQSYTADDTWQFCAVCCVS